MEAAAKRSAAVGEVRRLVSEGASLDAALAAAGVAATTYRRWAARLDQGGVAALADRPKSGRPPVVTLGEDEVFTVRADAAVAWTTRRPVGFVPRLRMRDVFLPRKRQENLMMHFYGPGNVWFEG